MKGLLKLLSLVGLSTVVTSSVVACDKKSDKSSNSDQDTDNSKPDNNQNGDGNQDGNKPDGNQDGNSSELKKINSKNSRKNKISKTRFN
ncbi:hypothetical protein [Mycoplasma capricolum]|uniref:hypothetical protein n=1 Tax=Mycoplasma capricolum TaxID=2095 RepID=UPI0004EF7D47|nr:hypothetical protein [Mycoplasma capricolum]CEA12021.1 hypothetical protein MCCPF38_00664 [Mycoplasma capricolum subsp. capripneumoniae]